MGLFDRFKKDPKNIPVYPDITFHPQRPVDDEVLETALENPNLESAIAKLGPPKKKVRASITDPRLYEQIYGRKKP
jgi:hypothetical protein